MRFWRLTSSTMHVGCWWWVCWCRLSSRGRYKLSVSRDSCLFVFLISGFMSNGSFISTLKTSVFPHYDKCLHHVYIMFTAPWVFIDNVTDVAGWEMRFIDLYFYIEPWTVHIITDLTGSILYYVINRTWIIKGDLLFIYLFTFFIQASMTVMVFPCPIHVSTGVWMRTHSHTEHGKVLYQ